MSIVEKALGKLQEAQSDGRRPAVRRRTPKTAETAEAEHRARVASRQTPELEVDFEHLRRAGMVPPEGVAERITHEFRRIKWPLLANALGKGAAPIERGNLIMVASASPGDGKTFTTLNLALSIALEADSTVLLVDTDVAKPHLSRVFGIDAEPGLLDVLLSDELHLGDVLIKTNVPGLRLLGAGQPHPNAPELLSSRRMAEIAEELSSRYSDRIVVLDSPPLLATNEAQVLAGLVGQIVVVVRADVTKRQAVEEAVSLLDPSKAINLVLNQNRTGLGSDYYYGPYY